MINRKKGGIPLATDGPKPLYSATTLFSRRLAGSKDTSSALNFRFRVSSPPVSVRQGYSLQREIEEKQEILFTLPPLLSGGKESCGRRLSLVLQHSPLPSSSES